MHLIFDLDGTLVDSLPGIRLAVENAVRRVLPERAGEKFEFEIGPPVRTVMLQALGEISEPDLQHLEAAFRQAYDNQAFTLSTLYPGVPETLQALRQAGHSLYLVTNKPALPTGRILDRLGLSKCFAAILSPDSRQPPFPDKTACLEYLLCERGISTAQAVYIGDAPSDARAARQAGIDFIGVDYGYGSFGSDEPKLHLLHTSSEILDAIANSHS